MMKIHLPKYAHDRVKEKESKKTSPGPVVTLSRELGCPAKILAKELVEAINKIIGEKKWGWISKEILEESARELNVHPSEIKHVFDYKKKGVFDEILAAQSKKYYRSEKKIRKSISNVIKSIATEGYVIIVGRGGAAITKSIPDSLHIRLQAPIEWRANAVSKRFDISNEEAKKFCVDYDRKRKQFLDYYWGNPSDHTIFDIIYNYSSMSREEILESIIQIMKMKKIIK
jgi:cytidylate kinase